MSQIYSLIPDSAPFSEEQRAWLNGFLAGWVGLQPDENDAGSAMAAISNGATATLPPEPEEEDFPWHDPALPILDRLSLAEDKPVERKLMAAMAQLDCGSCGYDCQKYAEAIANGEETSLKLCSPGGSETAKTLKQILKSSDTEPASPSTNGKPTTNGVAKVTSSEWSRKNPFSAKLLSVRNLNGEGSAKQTSHVEIDLAGSGLTYTVGDSLGVFPTNCTELVASILNELRTSQEEVVEVDGEPMPMTQALTERFCLSEITDELLELMSERSGDTGESHILKQYLDDPDPIEGWDVLDLLQHFRSARLSATEFLTVLSPMKPRLYSISSSLKAHPDQVHLTIARVAWEFKQRNRKGVASTLFSDRLKPGDSVRIFVQKSHGFTVPAELSAPAIMIGPGTGIAPFRAFLQERKATTATGNNWLFFGDQKAETDFLYREELESLQAEGCLTRLELAFSRDQAEKIYVQHRLQEHGREIWEWLQAGAHIYVCGDAKRMAVDVDNALQQIIAEHGGGIDGKTWLAELAKQKRYCRDVY